MKLTLSVLCFLLGCHQGRSYIVGPIQAQVKSYHMVCNDGTQSACSPYSRPQEPAWYQTTLDPVCCHGHGGPMYRYGEWVYQ